MELICYLCHKHFSKTIYMKKFLAIIFLCLLVLTVGAKSKGIKEFRAMYHQNLDPDPRNDGNWFIGPVEELKEPYVILLSKNYVRVDNVSYFIDKGTMKTQDYTEEENKGYAKSTAYAATSLAGETIFVTIEYANRENPNLYGFSIFNRANQGHFYLAELQP